MGNKQDFEVRIGIDQSRQILFIKMDFSLLVAACVNDQSSDQISLMFVESSIAQSRLTGFSPLAAVSIVDQNSHRILIKWLCKAALDQSRLTCKARYRSSRRSPAR